MGKIVVVLGSGAQGSTVAQKLNETQEVERIICADENLRSIQELAKQFHKVSPVLVDATKLEDILKLATEFSKIDLLVNALPLHFAKNCLEAALVFRCDYQDFAAGEGIGEDFLDGIKYLRSYYNKKFQAINRLAIIGTGSAPGLICLATRLAVRELDTCETIYNFVYEGVKTKQFLPFWFAPSVALSDMVDVSYAFIDGEIRETKPFSLPVYRKYSELTRAELFVEHAHDEPIYYGLNAKTLYKGLKNAYFKYGGLGIEFAMPLYRCGLLNRQAESFYDQAIIPFDFVLNHIPPAPKYKEEIEEIIQQGIIEDGGCMVVEAYGQKDKQSVVSEVHVFAPGLCESFEKAGLTAEQYLTGQSGFIYTKMFVQEKLAAKGLISSDMLSEQEIDEYFCLIKSLEISTKESVKKVLEV